MTTTQMPLRDRNLRFALLKAVADAINAELAGERDDHTQDLVTRYDDEGTTGFDVKLPDGTKVAKISLSVPKAHTDVVDTDALIAWCESNGQGWLVEETVYPAVPAHTVPAYVVPAVAERVEKRLDPELLASFLASVKPIKGSTVGEVVDPSTGSVVDGVTHTPDGRPKSFSVRYATDGRDELARAYHRGDLAHLTVGDTVLPQIGGDE